MQVARVQSVGDLRPALDRFALHRRRPVLVVVGGAGGMATSHLELVAPVLRDAVLPAVSRWNAAVVDGGTDAGVMRLIGVARRAAAVDWPLVGVAAVGTVAHPGSAPADPSGVRVEPSHTHALLVPGDVWGDEVPWLAEVAGALAGGWPSATLVVNGGALTRRDIDASLRHGRPVVVLSGSGRLADTIAGAPQEPGHDAESTRIASSPLTRVVDVRSPNDVGAALDAILGGAESAHGG